MSLLILNASVAHTATTNVIINNKVIVYYFCYPNILIFFLRCKINIVCVHRQKFWTKHRGLKDLIDMYQAIALPKFGISLDLHYL